MPQLRQDPITGQWVILATERAKRPSDYTLTRVRHSAGFCPFCAGNEHLTPNARLSVADPDGAPWAVRVVENKFPALAPEGQPLAQPHGPYTTLDGVGAHEVIIESPAHVTDLAELPDAQIARVLRAWRQRLDALAQDERLAAVVIFKNHGIAAGASLEHVHSQLIGLPIVPQSQQLEIQRAHEHLSAHGQTITEVMLAHELEHGQRLVVVGEHAVAMTPYASRVPFELLILPRVRRAAFGACEDAEIDGVARVLGESLRRLGGALEHPALNLTLHTAPLAQQHDPATSWRIHVLPTLSKLAGFEWGSGYHINPTPPEVAAEHLRTLELSPSSWI